MNLAIITDSTCDLRQARLEALQVQRVNLYVNFQGKIFKDWTEITPTEIIEGVQAGAALASTSQPSPQDFEEAYKEAIAKGAQEILCLTLSSELSGTFQSATIAKANITDVPITVFDSLSASWGLGSMVVKAVDMRKQGASSSDIVASLEKMRDDNALFFSVGTLDFLQKGGRIGRASALVGSLLNIKPILELKGGAIHPLGRARGSKKALKEMVKYAKAFIDGHKDKTVKVYFMHIQALEGISEIRQAMLDEGLSFVDVGMDEMGAVIAAHVGPSTYGLYMYAE